MAPVVSFSLCYQRSPGWLYISSANPSSHSTSQRCCVFKAWKGLEAALPSVKKITPPPRDKYFRGRNENPRERRKGLQRSQTGGRRQFLGAQALFAGLGMPGCLGVKCSLGIIIARGLLRTQMLRLPPRPTDSEMLEWGSASQALASCPGFEHTASLRSTVRRRIGTGYIEPSR